MRKSDRTRQTLLDAALSVFGRKGYSAATVDEIVRTAGVSKGVAYYHFKSKEDIASTILSREFDALTLAFNDLAQCNNPPQKVLLGMLEVFAARLYDNREVAQLFSAEIWRSGRAWSEGMRAYAQQLIDLIADQLERGKSEGSVRLDLDPSFAAASIVGLVVVDALYCVGGNGNALLERQQFIDHVYDFAHHAIAINQNAEGKISR